MSAAEYVYVWEFAVRPEHIAEFEHEYGPNGGWVRLFAGAPGYLGTQLLKDRSVPGRYLTVDRWRTEADYAAFRARCATQFAELDRRCERFTSDEKALGTFNAG